MAFRAPSADMGFVGFCQFEINTGSGFRKIQSRVQSFDLGLSQEIRKPNVINISYDRPVHHIQPEVVEGKIKFPILNCDNPSGLFGASVPDPTSDLWYLATSRNYYGRLKSFDVLTKYSAVNASFRYKQCYVDTFTFQTQVDEPINVSVDIKGFTRREENFTTIPAASNSSIAMWYNAFVTLRNSEYILDGIDLRNLTVKVENNIERFHTANGKLVPQDLVPRHRNIQGEITTLGRIPIISQYARDNSSRAVEDTQLDFGYVNSGYTFRGTIPNVILEVEEIALTNDVLETKMKWHSLPADNDITDYSVFGGSV